MEGNGKNLNPMALPIDKAAKLLSALARRQIPASQIEQDLNDGAPTNANGTINLLHYAAWLVKEMGRGD